MNGVTWAVLDMYAMTLEGAGVEGLGELLGRHEPEGRRKHTARVTACAARLLDDKGHQTPLGLDAARTVLPRLRLGTAGGTA